MEKEIKEQKIHTKVDFLLYVHNVISTILCHSVSKHISPWTNQQGDKLCDDLMKCDDLCGDKSWIVSINMTDGNTAMTVWHDQRWLTGICRQFLVHSWMAYIRIKCLRKPQNESQETSTENNATVVYAGRCIRVESSLSFTSYLSV